MRIDIHKRENNKAIHVSDIRYPPVLSISSFVASIIITQSPTALTFVYSVVIFKKKKRSIPTAVFTTVTQ